MKWEEKIENLTPNQENTALSAEADEPLESVLRICKTSVTRWGGSYPSGPVY